MEHREHQYAVILTGASEHDWNRTSFKCKAILEDLGFEIKVTTCPDNYLKTEYNPGSVALFVICYNGARWTTKAETIFENAVANNGVGVAIIHSSNNGFKGWKAFETMCALMWRRETTIINGHETKIGAGHGDYHYFDIDIISTHKAVNGLPGTLKNHPDELYHNLKHMHKAKFEVLAEAYSDTKYGGTGKKEPVVLISNFGEGRIWHITLGHVWPNKDADSVQSNAFKQLLKKGCLWASGG